MEIPDVFSSIAEASVTLAGFAAVFRAFSGAHDPDCYSVARLYMVIEGSVVVALLCYLPSWLLGVWDAHEVGWRVGAACGAVWTITRVNAVHLQILFTAPGRPMLLRLATPIGIVATLFFLESAAKLSWLSPASAYLAGVITLFASNAVAFIAQFRVERPT